MRVLAGVVVSVFVFLGACGSGSDGDGGDGGGGGPPDPIPFVDVAVRGDLLPGAKIHLYFDVLAAEDLVSAPDVEIDPPPDVVGMALTETELVLAQDLDDPNADRIFVYDDADLQGAPVTPSVQVLIPLVGGSNSNQLFDLEVFGGDAYVLSLQRQPLIAPDYRFRWLVHVFRDVASLTNASVPSATVELANFVATSELIGQTGIEVDADVLVVQTNATLYLALDPETLAGAETPDRTLDMPSQLGSDPFRVSLGTGRLYLEGAATITCFADPPNLTAGQVPLFTLEGPSLVLPAQDGAVETGGRLFSPGFVLIDGPPVVGFDLTPLPLNAQPPDVILDLPLSGAQRIAGAGGALITAQADTGTLAVFDRAGSIQDGDEPDGYLFAGYIAVVELAAVER